ncbi:MAG: hypothetical protein ACRDK3_10180 [Actinomycetota bacterium]
MAETRRWVLVTDGGQGGSRDCVAAVRALHVGGYHTTVTVSPGTRAAVSRYSRRRVRVPHVASEGYEDAVRAELERKPYLTVVCASEASMRTLGRAGLHLTDKMKLNEAAREVGIDIPLSRTFSSWSEVLAESGSLTYPLVVKPAVRTFSAERVEVPEQLRSLAPEDGEILIQDWIEDGLHALAGVMWEGRLVAATAERWLRIWPMDCGLASAAVTTAPDPVLEEKVVSLLGDYEGLFCAQFAGRRLIDLNLRVHSSHSLSVAAGVNLVAIHCDLLNGMPVPHMRAPAGFFYRWLEGDLRHILAARRAKSTSTLGTLRELLPRRGAAHSIESLRDPGPLLSRLVYGAGRVGMSSEQRRRDR